MNTSIGTIAYPQRVALARRHYESKGYTVPYIDASGNPIALVAIDQADALAVFVEVDDGVNDGATRAEFEADAAVIVGESGDVLDEVDIRHDVFKILHTYDGTALIRNHVDAPFFGEL